MSSITDLKEYQNATRLTRSIHGEIPLPDARENPRISDQIIAEWGYVYWRELDDGTVYGILPMTFGKGRVCADLDPFGYAEFWCFDNLLDAIEALRSWNPETSDEVEGWMRHFPSHRRRIGGDPSTEHIQP